MTFFADENLSPRMVELLEVFDRRNRIRAHVDYFKAATPDVEWLSELATWDPRPALLCGDGRILRNRAELAALKDAQLTFVHLAPGWTNLLWEEQAWKIIKCWPHIVHEVTRTRVPAILEVTIKGKVSRKGSL